MIRTLFLSFFLLSSCTFSENIGGVEVECIGISEMEDPRYTYEVNGWNVFMGIFFFELLFIPTIVVGADAFKCPTGMRQPSQVGAM